MKLTPSMRRVLRALDEHGDMDAAEISEVAFVAQSTLSGGGYLTKLLTMQLIRVSRWNRNTVGPFIPVYSITPGESKKKPVPYTAAEKCKRWKKRAGYYKPEYRRNAMARNALNQLLRITA